MTSELSDLFESDTDSESILEETVTISQDKLGRFDDFDGYSKQKKKLDCTVVAPSKLERYTVSTVLLFGEAPESQTDLLAKSLTGEVDDEYSFFHVHSVTGDFLGDDNNVSAALKAARKSEPAIVLLDCLDEYSFDEEEFEALRCHLQKTRNSSQRVTVVCTASESSVANYESLFEVIITVPAPGSKFRLGTIRDEVNTGVDTGVLKPRVATDLQYECLDTVELSLAELRTAVKRAIQRRLTEGSTDPPVALTTAQIQQSIRTIADEALPDASIDGIFGHNDEDTHEVNPSVPDVSFADIGGLDDEKQRIREATTIPFKNRDVFHNAGFSAGQGVLLHGPPGTGKTMLAKAVANELDHNFLSVQGPEIENPLVGESERQLRELFETARTQAPSILFFDEFDSLAPNRDSRSPSFKDDLVNTLLAELDGLEPLEEVIVLASTNRIDSLDDAVLRSGRFDTFIEVSLPEPADQMEIFKRHTDGLPTADDVTAEWFVAQVSTGFSGADIAAACRKALEFAATRANREGEQRPIVIRKDMQRAMETIAATDDESPLREFY